MVFTDNLSQKKIKFFLNKSHLLKYLLLLKLVSANHELPWWCSG